ncbi:MAG: DUF502 domain-containing protein [Verrucomicrobia bacterium]|nr:DUF502 domain-containing protein [Verrucomicrobiota bacterium]
MEKPLSWARTGFLTGLAVVFPALISIAIVVWLFGVLSHFTDTLLVFLPAEWTHERQGHGPPRLYWSLIALLLALLLVALLGKVARYYLGKKLLHLLDVVFLRVPLLNKVYGALKQVDEAFRSPDKSSFTQVVLVQFPRPGLYSVGLTTGAQSGELQERTGDRTLRVFVPETPNPTAGFLVLAPGRELVKLDMTVTEAIRFVMSLGAAAPTAMANGSR